jgi:hypothetical protein
MLQASVLDARALAERVTLMSSQAAAAQVQVQEEAAERHDALADRVTLMGSQAAAAQVQLAEQMAALRAGLVAGASPAAAPLAPTPTPAAAPAPAPSPAAPAPSALGVEWEACAAALAAAAPTPAAGPSPLDRRLPLPPALINGVMVPAPVPPGIPTREMGTATYADIDARVLALDALRAQSMRCMGQGVTPDSAARFLQQLQGIEEELAFLQGRRAMMRAEGGACFLSGTDMAAFRVRADRAVGAIAARAAGTTAAELLIPVQAALDLAAGITAPCPEDSRRVRSLQQAKRELLAGSDPLGSPAFLRGGARRSPGGGAGGLPGACGAAAGAAPSPGMPNLGMHGAGGWSDGRMGGGCGVGAGGGYVDLGSGGGSSCGGGSSAGAPDRSGGGGLYGMGTPGGVGGAGAEAAAYGGDGSGYSGVAGATAVGPFGMDEGDLRLARTLARKAVNVPKRAERFYGVLLWQEESVIEAAGSIHALWTGATNASVHEYKYERLDHGAVSRTDAAVLLSDTLVMGKVQRTVAEEHIPGLDCLIVAAKKCRWVAATGTVARSALESLLRALQLACTQACEFHCHRVASAHGWDYLGAEHPVKKAFVVEFNFYEALERAFVKEVTANGHSAGVALIEYSVAAITSCIAASTAGDAVVNVSQRFFMFAHGCRQCMTDDFRNRRWKERMEDKLHAMSRRMEEAQSCEIGLYEQCITQQDYVSAGYPLMCLACGRIGHPFIACAEKQHVESARTKLTLAECKARASELAKRRAEATGVATAPKGKGGKK